MPLEQGKQSIMRRGKLSWLIIKFLFTGILFLGCVYYVLNIYERTVDRKTDEEAELKTHHVVVKRPIQNLHVAAIDGMSIEKLRDNYFISDPDYQHRMNPIYFHDPAVTLWQLDSYQFAAELGKRYGCKYFIDIGCGSAYKTAMVRDQFQAIAVDYGDNFLKSKAKFPNIQFIPLDLGKRGCSFELPASILSQSIVLSADVIEHIPDPFACFLPLMSNLTKYAKAVIISTPDRSKLNTLIKNKSKSPKNGAHVREWKLEELEAMFADRNLVSLLSGWECRHQKCDGGFTWDTSPYTTNIISLASVQATDAWQEERYTGITVFILVHPNTKPSLYNDVINYYQAQGMDTVIFSSEPLKLDTLNKQKVITVAHIDDVIREIANKRRQMDANHWFLFVDGHEIVQPPNRRLRQWNLAECISAINREKDGFNAIPLTILFREAAANHSDLPFKMFVPGPWETKSGVILQNGFDTLLDRVRIWKNTISKATPVIAQTKWGDTIKDFTLTDRKIYPYNFISIRFEPDKTVHVSDVFDDKMERIHAVDVAISHVSKQRAKIIERNYIF